MYQRSKNFILIQNKTFVCDYYQAFIVFKISILLKVIRSCLKLKYILVLKINAGLNLVIHRTKTMSEESTNTLLGQS